MLPDFLYIERLSGKAITFQVVIFVTLVLVGYISNGYMGILVAVYLLLTSLGLTVFSPLFNWQIINIVFASALGWAL